MGERILAIIGVGLIGGSVGLAAKKRGLFAEVRGTTRRKSTLQAALEAGAIDRAFSQAKQAARGADFVVVATPVSSIPDYRVECAAVAKEGAIVTDVGSVKGKIHAEVMPRMPAGRHFVGSHPLAGSEKKGVVNARADLFSGATCIVTASETTGEDACRAVSDFWEALGTKVCRMSPADHDAIVAGVSHLPHLVASALIRTVADRALPFGASGLRDTTRVAAGDAATWRDIIEANRDEVLIALEGFAGEIATLKRLVLAGDFTGVEEYLGLAAERRRKRFPGTGEGGTA